MKDVRIKKMQLENFKCFSCFEVSFDSVETNLAGRNGSGKTSLYDGFLWLLTGKDSKGNESFKVQPVDEHNSTIPKLKTSVTAEFEIDGVTHTFTKTLKQKWVTPRGKYAEVLQGNESGYFIDGTPLTMTEYNKRIKEFFCEMEDFKLITNIGGFFSLPVKDQRALLVKMAGDMPNILTAEAYPHLFEKFQSIGSIDDIKKQCLFAIKELTTKKDGIPYRITENERDMPNRDFASLKDEKGKLDRRIAEIDGILQRHAEANTSLFNQEFSKQKELSDIEGQILEAETSFTRSRQEAINKFQSACSDIHRKVESCQADIRNYKSISAQIKTRLDSQTSRIKQLGSDWSELNSKMFDIEIETICPTCQRPFSEDEIAEKKNVLVKKFNEDKVKRLKAIADEGNKVAELKKQTDKELSDSLKKIEEAEEVLKGLVEQETEARNKLTSVPSIDALKNASADYYTLIQKRTELRSLKEESKKAPQISEDDQKLEDEKAALKARLHDVITFLAEEKMIDKVISRRNELEAEATDIASKIAEQEQLLSEIRNYQKENINAVESKIASMFTMVKFQMYEKNLTNDGEREICECLVGGVPYSMNLNTASKFNAGIDLCNAVSRWLGITMPIWIDNKESVSKLIATPSQLITLSVDENCEILSVM